MVNDGTKTYNHLQDGEGNLLAGCHAKILNTQTPIHAKIIYHNNVLEVLLFTSHDQGWSPCFKVPNIKLPKSGFIGMTAITGDATAAHELIGITTGTYHMGSGDNFANAETEEMEERHARLFFIILGIAMVAAGYHYFKKQKKKNVF